MRPFKLFIMEKFIKEIEHFFKSNNFDLEKSKQHLSRINKPKVLELKKLAEIARQYPDILVLPAHRLYYNNHWNRIRLADRVDELVEHHIQRCGAIIEILGSGPKSAEEIAKEHFEERLMEGIGSFMAVNEIISHCELLVFSGDVVAVDDNTYSATGCSKRSHKDDAGSSGHPHRRWV